MRPRSWAAADTASVCSGVSSRTRAPFARTSTVIPAESSTQRWANAAPSINEGATNQEVVTPSSRRQSDPAPTTFDSLPMLGTLGTTSDNPARSRRQDGS